MKSLLKNTALTVFKLLIYIFRIFPIRSNRVVFRSSSGTKYNCCPKYITEYILETCPEDFEIIWIFNDPKQYQQLTAQSIRLCRANSLASLYYFATARFVVDNHGPNSYFTKRKGQYVFNTWHGGGAYKKGFKNQAASHTAYTVVMKQNTDYFIASCRRIAACGLFSDSPEKILPFGMARSDLFFRDTTAVRKKVFAHFGIAKDEKLLLYAPTYRYFETDTVYGLDCEKVTAACRERFGGTFRFAYRMHEFIIHNKTDMSGKNYINMNDYDDMQEILAAADVIITDYSSLIWDAALMKKPCFIFATDLAQFIEERDFYTPVDKWPFPLAQSNQELTAVIGSFDEADYRIACAQHLESLGSFETGESAKKTVALMKQLNNQ